MDEELEQRILDVLEPRIVPLRFVKAGHLLRIGDVTYIGSWSDLSWVGYNLNDERRRVFGDDDYNRYLTPVPIRCVGDFSSRPGEFLVGQFRVMYPFKLRSSLDFSFLDMQDVVSGYMKEHEEECERAKRLTDRP